MESNLVKHARAELARIDPGEDEMAREMQEVMNKGLIEIVKVFAEQGHSGFSASYAIARLERLLRYEPLTPLTGDDDEWTEVGRGLFQNKRCSHVFRDESGAYDINGRIFREPNGSCFRSHESRVPVTFPYVPKSEYVDLPA